MSMTIRIEVGGEKKLGHFDDDDRSLRWTLFRMVEQANRWQANLAEGVVSNPVVI